MAQLAADCPRCGVKRTTFNVAGVTPITQRYGWQYEYEAFCVCRHCRTSTVFVLEDKVGSPYTKTHQIGLVEIEGSINGLVDVLGFINARDMVVADVPEYTPAAIGEAFREAVVCMSVGCYNAAGAMFRLAIDLATGGMLPEGEKDGPDRHTRRSLGLRLAWMFKHSRLPKELEDLSTAVREDGNDGAHAGSLTRAEAEDLLEFTRALLERLFTVPGRLKAAAERREERRAGTERK